MRYLSFMILTCILFCLVVSERASSKDSTQKPPPLCKPRSKYSVGKADLNKSVSPCDLYFTATETFSFPHKMERFYRVMIRRGKPFKLDEYGRAIAPISPQDQLRPYYYKWIVLDDNGTVVRSWLAYFIKNRDYSYHTVIRQPQKDWDNSVLEIYFEDVNGDGVREDVTYVLRVGEILKGEKSSTMVVVQSPNGEDWLLTPEFMQASQAARYNDFYWATYVAGVLFVALGWTVACVVRSQWPRRAILVGIFLCTLVIVSGLSFQSITMKWRLRREAAKTDDEGSAVALSDTGNLAFAPIIAVFEGLVFSTALVIGAVVVRRLRTSRSVPMDGQPAPPHGPGTEL